MKNEKRTKTNSIKKLKYMLDKLYNQFVFIIRKPQYKTKPEINGKIYLVRKTRGD